MEVIIGIKHKSNFKKVRSIHILKHCQIDQKFVQNISKTIILGFHRSVPESLTQESLYFFVKKKLLDPKKHNWPYCASKLANKPTDKDLLDKSWESGPVCNGRKDHFKQV